MEPELKEASEKVSTAADVVKNIVAATTEATVEIQRRNDEHMTGILSDALREVFDAHKESGRFIDVSRIPLLCKAVLDIHENIKDIKNKLDNKFVTIEMFSPVRMITFGLVGAILFAVIGALMMLVIK